MFRSLDPVCCTLWEGSSPPFLHCLLRPFEMTALAPSLGNIIPERGPPGKGKSARAAFAVTPPGVSLLPTSREARPWRAHHERTGGIVGSEFRVYAVLQFRGHLTLASSMRGMLRTPWRARRLFSPRYWPKAVNVPRRSASGLPLLRSSGGCGRWHGHPADDSWAGREPPTRNSAPP